MLVSFPSYFEVSASGSLKWQSGLCVLRPSLQPQCCLLFSCSMSPSIIPAGLESKWTFITQAMSATTEDADQSPAGAAVTWSFQAPSFPILPSVDGALNSSPNWDPGSDRGSPRLDPLPLDGLRSFKVVVLNPRAQQNATIEAMLRMRTEQMTISFSPSTQMHWLESHTSGFEILLCRSRALSLWSLCDFLYDNGLVFLLENGATDLMRWKRTFKNIQNEMKSKMWKIQNEEEWTGGHILKD